MDESRSSYRIKIKIGDKELEVEGDKEFVERNAEILFNKVYQEVTPKEAKPTQEEKITFNEFINERSKTFGKDPDQLSGFQKILLIAYYVFRFENRDFTYEDIERYAQEARLSGLANPRQYMSEIIRKGLVKESGISEDKKKTFKILRGGIQYVESNFKESYEAEERSSEALSS
ncbi:MAG: hypothetical protein JTT16_00535 [Candidatus Brockarchaeota archaeon]|nr:hypothetical protein [Candidatus Brockarchaeota archaeon]MBO3801607.1 hypothetical protein [Candidatus Brockarchaeota archaeon]